MSGMGGAGGSGAGTGGTGSGSGNSMGNNQSSSSGGGAAGSAAGAAGSAAKGRASEADVWMPSILTTPCHGTKAAAPSDLTTAGANVKGPQIGLGSANSGAGDATMDGGSPLFGGGSGAAPSGGSSSGWTWKPGVTPPHWKPAKPSPTVGGQHAPAHGSAVASSAAQIAADRAEIKRLADIMKSKTATDAEKKAAKDAGLAILNKYPQQISELSKQVKFAGARERDILLQEIAKRIDVTSDLSKVFWSGPQGKEHAANWALQNGSTILEQTSCVMVDNWAGVDWSWAKPGSVGGGGFEIFGAISAEYAKDAEGVIHVFQNQERWNEGGGGVWKLYEYPAIVAGGKVPAIVYHRVDGDGNILESRTEWLQGGPGPQELAPTVPNKNDPQWHASTWTHSATPIGPRTEPTMGTNKVVPL